VLFSQLEYAEPRPLRPAKKWSNRPFAFLSSVASISKIKEYLDTWNQEISYLTFSDHATYTESIVKRIIDKVRKVNKSVILTTSKDEVKLLPFASMFENAGIEVFVLDVRHAFTAPEEATYFRTFVS
jgi:tetraacyldisaccharide-1-P 4'-kinase